MNTKTRRFLVEVADWPNSPVDAGYIRSVLNASDADVREVTEQTRLSTIGGSLPTFDPEDYRGDIVMHQHREEINGHDVYRNEVLRADDRIMVHGMLLRHIERLPEDPHVIVIRDEIDGRVFHYRQAGWNHTAGFYPYVGAFERLHAAEGGGE